MLGITSDNMFNDPGWLQQTAPFIYNSLPSDKILDESKLKVFADDKIHVNEKSKFVLARVEKIVGKGENAGYQHFLILFTIFSKGFFLRVIKSQDCVVKVNCITLLED